MRVENLEVEKWSLLMGYYKIGHQVHARAYYRLRLFAYQQDDFMYIIILGCMHAWRG